MEQGNLDQNIVDELSSLMNRFAFAPLFDLPLFVVVSALFIWHYRHWAINTELDSTADLVARWPGACTRTVCLLSAVLVTCWLLNFAFWGVLFVLFVAGMIFAGSAEFGLLGSAIIIREWSFGFPQLILSPKTRLSDPLVHSMNDGPLMGKTGIALSRLRPMGDVEIAGTTVTATSDDGQLIEAGTRVKVTAYRNSRPCVAPDGQPNTKD